MTASQELIASPRQEPDENRASLAESFRANLALVGQVVALGVALWAPLIVIMIWMSDNMTGIRTEIADLRTELTAEIQALDDRLSTQMQESDDRLSMRIQALDDRIVAVDNKINAIGQMTVFAFNDGEMSQEEIAAIWESAISSK